MPLATYAGVRQQAQVMKAVAQEHGFCGERQATVRADEHALFVTLEMVKHGSAMAEAVFAFGAGVAFSAPLVCLHVFLALHEAGENALAEITLIKLFLKVVRVQMVLQFVLCCKLGRANDALKSGRLSVRAQVLAIVHEVTELLAAFCAAVETNAIMYMQMFM